MARGARPDWRTDLDVLDRIERALTREQHAGLHEHLRLGGIEPDAWLAIPALRQVYGSMAATNITAPLQLGGMSEENAYLEASCRLGIPASTLVTWARRWSKYAA